MINQPEIDDLGASPYLDLLSTSVLPAPNRTLPWRPGALAQLPSGHPLQLRMRCAPRAHIAPPRGQGGRAALQLLGRGGGPGGGPGDRLRPGDGTVRSLGNGQPWWIPQGWSKLLMGWPTVLWQQRRRQGFKPLLSMYWKSTNDIQITLW